MSVDKILVDALKQKEARGNQTQITPINNDSLIFYNSVNLAVGKQGAGKSLLFLREVLKIQKEKNIQIQMDTIRHIVYCWKEFKIVDGKPMETEKKVKT